ncbi:MAG: hypothetical protein PQJ50_01640, partial [Spirochaetales bacterium]|nr:hypothetical protein [Spirochaetales bacterium]
KVIFRDSGQSSLFSETDNSPAEEKRVNGWSAPGIKRVSVSAANSAKGRIRRRKNSFIIIPLLKQVYIDIIVKE